LYESCELLDRAPFRTADGLAGHRFVFDVEKKGDGALLHTIAYVIFASEGTLECLAAGPVDDNDAIDELYDEFARSLRIEPAAQEVKK